MLKYVPACDMDISNSILNLSHGPKLPRKSAEGTLARLKKHQHLYYSQSVRRPFLQGLAQVHHLSGYIDFAGDSAEI